LRYPPYDRRLFCDCAIGGDQEEFERTGGRMVRRGDEDDPVTLVEFIRKHFERAKK
jgi:hypothetical protein